MDPLDPITQAIFLKPHVRLMALGLRHSRLTKGQILDKTERVTGKTYPRGRHTTPSLHQAYLDLKAITDGLKKPTDGQRKNADPQR